MTPVDVLERRVSRVETDTATVQERVRNLADTVEKFSATATDVAVLSSTVKGLAEDVSGLSTQVGAVGKMLEKRDQQASSERNAVKIALISLTGVISTSVLGGVIALLAGG